MSVAANNRFLSKTNPQLTRALADSGSSLNHPEIQRLARQQVDLGIWSNLKLWVHRDLVKTRTSGSDLFVSKAYDMSGNNNDAAQTTEANQPKLVSAGMQFDGSNDSLSIPHSSNLEPGTNNFTFILWWYISSSGDNRLLSKGAHGTTNPGYSVLYQSGNIIFRSIDANYPTVNKRAGLTKAVSSANWYMLTVIFNRTTNLLSGYVNSDNWDVGVTGDDINGINVSLNTPLKIGVRQDLTTFGFGTIGQLSMYNTALTADQISAIYNESKSYYGL